MKAKARVISAERARRFLVDHLQLRCFQEKSGHEGVRQVFERLRCIQLDPLDVIGSNADLVAMARVQGLQRGDVYQALLPGHAFEHYAKELCLLPSHAFPYYRELMKKNPSRGLTERLKRVPKKTLELVLAEVERRGPSQSRDLSEQGKVKALDWSGWKGTARMTTMALQVLWKRCQIVVHSRLRNGKRYSQPKLSLGDWADQEAAPDFDRWALLERVYAAGLLTLALGPQWGLIGHVRDSSTLDDLLGEGLLELVQIEGSRRLYLAPGGFLDFEGSDDDGRMRILGPLDPLIWDRKLVKHIFDFEYIWEVYKPAKKRRWGWYVCPILWQGRLIGRFEGVIEDGQLVVKKLWKEKGESFDEGCWQAAIERGSVGRVTGMRND